jgi:hypothetical protein
MSHKRLIRRGSGTWGLDMRPQRLPVEVGSYKMVQMLRKLVQFLHAASGIGKDYNFWNLKCKILQQNAYLDQWDKAIRDS